jgi:acetyltransferase-like isoleucine patch superfamily enzyme
MNALNKIENHWKKGKRELLKECFFYGKKIMQQGFFQTPRILKYKILSDFGALYGKPILKQPVQFVGKGKICIGDGVIFGVHSSPEFYSGYGYIEARNNNSQVVFGNDVWINNSCRIISEGEGVFIGNNCLMGYNVNIYDSNFHDLEPNLRRISTVNSAKVIIEDNVFIGSNVTILKGCKIGINSVIGAGAVVVGDIPPNSIAAGNPCKVLKSR